MSNDFNDFKNFVASMIGIPPGLSSGRVAIETSDETKTIKLPAGMSKEEGAKWLQRAHESDEQVINVVRTFDCEPLEGAWALAQVLKRKYGWTALVERELQVFFSSVSMPPTLFEIKLDGDNRATVPFGEMQIPGIDGTIKAGANIKKNLREFILSANVKRKHETEVTELVAAVEREIRENSIFKGKAISIEFRDASGEMATRDWDWMPEFLTIEANPEGLVFPSDTELAIEASLFAPIRYHKFADKHRLPAKRGILLEGPYGVGKTLCAQHTAKLCAENGWTFIHLGDVRDLEQAVQFAQRHQPAVVFSEDVDRTLSGERTSDIDRILNVLDGITSKDTAVITVLTTNDVGSINRALLRPGRIDAIVPIRAPDAEAARKLVRFYGGANLNVDLKNDAIMDTAIEPLVKAGANAATIRECVDRAGWLAVSRSNGKSSEVDALLLNDVADSMASFKFPEVPAAKTALESAFQFLTKELTARIVDEITEVTEPAKA